MLYYVSFEESAQENNLTGWDIVNGQAKKVDIICPSVYLENGHYRIVV
jgi:hypothetical protein